MKNRKYFLILVTVFTAAVLCIGTAAFAAEENISANESFYSNANSTSIEDNVPETPGDQSEIPGDQNENPGEQNETPGEQPAPVIYEVLSGNNTVWTQDSSAGNTTNPDTGANAAAGVSIRINCEPEKLVSVYLDKVLVDPSNYIVRTGSTIIEFKPEFLATLPDGPHTVTAEFTDGSAIAQITTVKVLSNDTGTDNQPSENNNTPGGNTPGGNNNTPGGNENTPGGNANVPGGNGNAPGGESSGAPGGNTNAFGGESSGAPAGGGAPGGNGGAPNGNNGGTPKTGDPTPAAMIMWILVALAAIGAGVFGLRALRSGSRR